MDRDSLVVLLGQGLSVEEIGRRFGRHASTVSYWLAKYGLEAVNKDKHAAKGGVERSRLEPLVDAGMTIAEIADQVGLSKSAVRHWLRRYDLRTRNGRGRRARRPDFHEAKDAGLLESTMECGRHGETEFAIEGRGYYRCKRCRSESVARRRRKLKATLVAEAGGCCRLCGYDRHLGALAFHHLDPSQKRLQISWNGVTLSLDTLRAEVRKCVLLCANCHAEVEAGVVALPARVSLSDDPSDTS